MSDFIFSIEEIDTIFPVGDNFMDTIDENIDIDDICDIEMKEDIDWVEWEKDFDASVVLEYESMVDIDFDCTPNNLELLKNNIINMEDVDGGDVVLGKRLMCEEEVDVGICQDSVKKDVCTQTTIDVSCNCSKNGCLKKYCPCRKADQACGEECSCKKCLNTGDICGC